MKYALPVILAFCLMISLTSAATVDWQSQEPPDISIENLFNTPLYINYTIVDDPLDVSSIFIYYKSNSTVSNIMYYQNGTAYTGFFNLPYLFNTTSNFTFRLLYNEIYPGIYMIGPVTVDNLPHTAYHINGVGQYIKSQLVNISNETPIFAYEIMANSTATANPANLIYCNDSYVQGNMLISPYCGIVETVPANTSFSHCHINSSCHREILLPINISSGTIGSVKITSNGFFAFGGAINWDIWYVTPTIRINATQTSLSRGTTWTPQTYTVDQHAHQYYSNSTANSSLYYYACIENVTCSTEFQDLLELGGIPPTAPIIYSPDLSRYNTGDIILVNYSESMSPNGYAIKNYSIEIYADGGATGYYIAENNYLNLSYLWDTTGETEADNLQIAVHVCDENELCSIGFSLLFNLNNKTLTFESTEFNNGDTIIDIPESSRYNGILEFNITSNYNISNGTYGLVMNDTPFVCTTFNDSIVTCDIDFESLNTYFVHTGYFYSNGTDLVNITLPIDFRSETCGRIGNDTVVYLTHDINDTFNSSINNLTCFTFDGNNIELNLDNFTLSHATERDGNGIKIFRNASMSNHTVYNGTIENYNIGIIQGSNNSDLLLIAKNNILNCNDAVDLYGHTNSFFIANTIDNSRYGLQFHNDTYDNVNIVDNVYTDLVYGIVINMSDSGYMSDGTIDETTNRMSMSMLDTGIYMNNYNGTINQLFVNVNYSVIINNSYITDGSIVSVNDQIEDVRIYDSFVVLSDLSVSASNTNYIALFNSILNVTQLRFGFYLNDDNAPTLFSSRLILNNVNIPGIGINLYYNESIVNVTDQRLVKFDVASTPITLSNCELAFNATAVNPLATSLSLVWANPMVNYDDTLTTGLTINTSAGLVNYTSYNVVSFPTGACVNPLSNSFAARSADAVYYVNQTPFSCGGVNSTFFSTLSDALAASGNNQIITMCSGTYYENANITQDNLTINSAQYVEIRQLEPFIPIITTNDAANLTISNLHFISDINRIIDHNITIGDIVILLENSNNTYIANNTFLYGLPILRIESNASNISGNNFTNVIGGIFSQGTSGVSDLANISSNTFIGTGSYLFDTGVEIIELSAALDSCSQTHIIFDKNVVSNFVYGIRSPYCSDANESFQGFAYISLNNTFTGISNSVYYVNDTRELIDYSFYFLAGGDYLENFSLILSGTNIENVTLAGLVGNFSTNFYLPADGLMTHKLFNVSNITNITMFTYPIYSTSGNSYFSIDMYEGGLDILLLEPNSSVTIPDIPTNMSMMNNGYLVYPQDPLVNFSICENYSAYTLMLHNISNSTGSVALYFYNGSDWQISDTLTQISNTYPVDNSVCGMVNSSESVWYAFLGPKGTTPPTPGGGGLLNAQIRTQLIQTFGTIATMLGVLGLITIAGMALGVIAIGVGVPIVVVSFIIAGAGILIIAAFP